MIESFRAELWLFATLNAAPAITGSRIYSGVAPQDAVLPATVFQFQGGTDLATSGAARVWADLLYLVKVIGKTSSFAALQAAADEVDARLHNKRGTTSDGRVLSCVREQPFQLVEVDQGINYRHLGGFYRLLVQPL